MYFGNKSFETDTLRIERVAIRKVSVSKDLFPKYIKQMTYSLVSLGSAWDPGPDNRPRASIPTGLIIHGVSSVFRWRRLPGLREAKGPGLKPGMIRLH